MNGTKKEGFEFRRYLGLLAVGVVATVAFLGFVIGLTVQTEFETVRVLHVVAIRPTPLALAGLAGAIATVVLLVLFALLRIASRYDDAAPRE